MSDALSETPFIFSVRLIEIALGGNSKGTARRRSPVVPMICPAVVIFVDFWTRHNPTAKNGAIYSSHVVVR